MNRAAVAVRSGPKNCKDVFKITETDSGPGRVANQLKDIRKDPPPEIGREAGIGEISEMKSLEGLPAKKEQSGEQQKQKRDHECDPGGRTLPERKDSEPKRATRNENSKTGA